MTKKNKGGRPTDYTEELGNTICDMFSHGASMKEVSAEIGFNPSSVYLWLSKNQEFSDKYARAKADGQEAEMEGLKEIADKVLDKTYEPQQARVAADILKWRVSKLAPKKYGEKSQIEHTGTMGLTDMTEEALKQKLKELEDEQNDDKE